MKPETVLLELSNPEIELAASDAALHLKAADAEPGRRAAARRSSCPSRLRIARSAASTIVEEVHAAGEDGAQTYV